MDYRVALIIDSENVSYKYIDDIVNEIAKYGKLVIARFYGDINAISKEWRDKAMEYAIKPVHQYNVAVGDDWQSIYAFAGSEVSLFTRFKESMGYADLLHITHTYRNSQELIDIAGDFVQKNNTQIKKTLKSNKSIQKPVVIFSYSDDTYKNEKKGKSGVIYEKAIIIDSIIQKIVQVHGENTSILLIGRFGFDAERLSISELFTYENEMLKSTNYPSVKITALTAHSSKGLGFDNVIIINATNDTYGFPSKIETDPILKLVIEDDKAIDFAEERRLFFSINSN